MSACPPRRTRLVAHLKTGPTGSHAGGWRHPAAALHDVFDPRRCERLARTLEDGRFDAGFSADTFGVPDVYGGHFRTYVGRGGRISYLDPMLALPLTARVTEHLGPGATLSTTFHPPCLLARMLRILAPDMDLADIRPRTVPRACIALMEEVRRTTLNALRETGMALTIKDIAPRPWRNAS